MLSEKIDGMIASAMKHQEKERLGVYKLIKAEFSKMYHNGVEMNEANETKALMKMAAQREDSINQYLKGNRKDLADIEKQELEILDEFMPKQPTEEEITGYTEKVIEKYISCQTNDYTLSMKDMKPIMVEVQKMYPSANGKVISQILKKKI